MSSEFTPGPWKQYAPEIDGANDPNYRTVEGGVGYLDEDGGEPGFRLTGFIRPSDASLLAAAPELYQTLKNVLATFGDPANGKLFGIRAVLAKAEGRQ